MDMIEFSNKFPGEQLALIFKNFFSEHVAMYDVLSGLEFVSINAKTNTSSIMYCVKLLDTENKNLLISNINNFTVSVYGKCYIPKAYLNGDLLCVTFEK